MNGVGVIILGTVATIATGAAAVLALSASVGRVSQVAQSLGVSDDSRRHGPVAVLLAQLQRLPLTRRLRQRLIGAGLDWDPAITELALAVLVVLVFLGVRPFIGRIAGGVLAAAVPFAFSRWMQRRAAQRTERFIAQLPDVSRVLSNGTSAGMSVERALGLAAVEVSEPAKTELNRVVAQLGLGWALESALTDLSERMPSRELDVLVRTIIIQSRSGGTLVTALQEIAYALEDRKQLHREVRTAILGSAVSGYIVPVMGVGCVVLLNLMKPGVLDDMASSFIGRLILLIAFVFFGLGALLIRLVSRVEV